MNRNILIGHVCAAITIMIWGSTFIFTQILLEDLTPIEILFFRFIIGYVVLWIIRPGIFHTGSVQMEICFAMAGLTGIFLNYYCENAALLYTSAAVVSVIVSGAPFLVGIAAVPILGHKLPRFFIPGFLVAIAGIAIVSFSGSETASGEMRFLGQAIALGACVTWTVYSLLSEKINGQGFDIILVSRRLFFYGIVFTAPFYFWKGDLGNVRLLLRPDYAACILFLGIAACAISFMTWNYAIAVLGAVTTNVYAYMLPVIPILLSFIVFGDPITPALALGTVLAIVGLALSEWK